jgi:hypothetical protein
MIKMKVLLRQSTVCTKRATKYVSIDVWRIHIEAIGRGSDCFVLPPDISGRWGAEGCQEI